MAPAVASLRAQLDDLITESQRLRGDVATAELARRRTNQLMLSGLAILTVFVFFVLVIGWQNNQVIRQVSETNKQTHETSDRIADCTTAGGKCFEEGRKRTADAVQDILLVSIYMAECARLYPGESGPEYDRKLEACVYERLEKANEDRPSPSPSTSG